MRSGTMWTKNYMIPRCGEQRIYNDTDVYQPEDTESGRQMHQNILMAWLCTVTAIKYIIGNNI